MPPPLNRRSRPLPTARSRSCRFSGHPGPGLFLREVASDGRLLKYYEQFTQQIVGPAAKLKGVKTTAVVLRAALTGELHPDSAVVLLFVNQTTQSKDRPEPTMTSSSVVATMTKADDKWLISSFNPT